MFRFVTYLALLLLVGSVYGGRPLAVDEAGTADKGALELELGIETEFENLETSAITAAAIFGFCNVLELSAECGFSTENTEIEVFAFATKLAPEFVRFGSVSFALAAGYDIIGETGDVLIISTSDTRRISFDWNAGMSFDSELKARETSIGCAFRYEMTGDIQVVGEALWTGLIDTDIDCWWVAAGVRYNPSPVLTLDIAPGLSIAGDETTVCATAGMTLSVF